MTRAGKTGGGPGSNQYGAKGVSSRAARMGKPRARPPLPLPDVDSVSDEDVPAPQTVFAVRSPSLDTDALMGLVSSVRPRGVERGLARWRKRLPGLVWNDASLEGNAFTLPDVTTLLDGETVDGYSADQVNQVLDLSRAARIVEEASQRGPIDVSETLSARLNAAITAHEIIEPGILRGEGRVRGEATVSTMGTTFAALPTVAGGDELRRAFDQSAGRANALPHPVARAVAWAGFGAYHQFYGNGNKRTARYVMNAVLLSHGFDAILTPMTRKHDYNLALRDMYLTGDLTRYVLFLADLYDDSH